jgi:hypothetical protein
MFAKIELNDQSKALADVAEFNDTFCLVPCWELSHQPLALVNKQQLAIVFLVL